MDTEAIRRWWREYQRDLPWREPSTPAWQILVSEVMLQQTPVARVIPAWEAWVARWPDAKALAGASLGEVLSQWDRLGYPRRAKNLHQTATIVTQNHGGVLPRDVEALEKLPGIGRYTSRAVACFADGQPVPVVDTNVARVVARHADGDAAAGHWSGRYGLERVDALCMGLSPEDYCETQRGLMELGALVCTARNPRCAECPISTTCRWRKADYPVDPTVMPSVQARYEGSDRQARGVILGWLRDNPGPLDSVTLAQLWDKTAQRKRAVNSLVTDGLIQRHDHPDRGEHFSLSWQRPDRDE